MITKKVVLTVLLINTLLFILHAQNVSLEWVQQMGGTEDDNGRDIITDASGNVYTVGHFRGTADFDPGAGINNLTSVGFIDIFIQKLSPSGDLLWIKQIGGEGYDYGSSIILDDSGAVYITGSFESTVDFDPGAGISNLTSTGNKDVFVQKLDNNGDFIWAKQMGGIGYDYGTFIELGPNGNLYVTGSFAETADFDPGTGIANLTSVGLRDVFIEKLDANGNFGWVKQISGTSTGTNNSVYSTSANLEIDMNGNVFSSGAFWDTAYFNHGAGVVNLTSLGGTDIFIQKLDTDGNFEWVKHIGGTGSDGGGSMTTNMDGDIYAIGSFKDTIDIDGDSLISNSESNSFIQKLDSNGNLIWVKEIINGTDYSGAGSITNDANGNIYFFGIFKGTVDLNPGSEPVNLTSVGEMDIFIEKLDANGNFVWAQQMGGADFDNGRSMTMDDNGNIYIIGHFRGTADFDPGIGMTNLTSAGDSDIFIQKMRLCSPTTDLDEIIACDSLTWIDGNTYTTTNNTATHTLVNTAGCDSIVTLDLTIYSSSDVWIDEIVACDSYTWIDGNTYTTTNNTATHTLVNAVGCDSIIALDLTINSVSDISVSTNNFTATANNPNATFQWLDCDDNNNPLAGETDAYFIAPDNGYYAVEITENNCVDTSECILLNTVGLLENSLGTEFEVYPNPTKDGQFNIVFEKMMNEIEVSILSLEGKMIEKSLHINTSIIGLNIEAAAGVYFVEIKGLEGKQTIRVVKE